MRIVRWIGALSGLFVLAAALWYWYARMRPPHEQVPLRAELLEMKRWTVNGQELQKWPPVLPLKFPATIELEARPTRPVAQGPTQNPIPESVILFLIDKKNPGQPMESGGGLLSEAGRSGPSLGVISASTGQSVIDSHPASLPVKGPLRPDRFRLYKGTLTPPPKAGDYVVMVAVGSAYGTFAPPDPTKASEMPIVEQIHVAYE